MWTVSYCSTDSTRVVAKEHAGERVVLSGCTVDRDACRDALLRWLRRKAAAVLEPWLREMAQEGGFTVEALLANAAPGRARLFKVGDAVAVGWRHDAGVFLHG